MLCEPGFQPVARLLTFLCRTLKPATLSLVRAGYTRFEDRETLRFPAQDNLARIDAIGATLLADCGANHRVTPRHNPRRSHANAGPISHLSTRKFACVQTPL